MDKILKEKITAIWNKPNRRYNNNTFTKSEIEFMINTPKFIWDYFNGVSSCECGDDLDFISLIKGYKDLCITCSKKLSVEKRKKTMLKKYGVEHNLQIKEIQMRVNNSASTKKSREKAQKTMKINGTHQSSSKHKTKVKVSKLNKYGNEKYTNITKQRETKLERYGNEYYSNQKKASETMMKRYGVSRFAKTAEFKENQSGITNPTYNHFNNIDDFNDSFIIKNFIKNDIFDLIGACNYFNCTYNTFKNKYYYDAGVKIGKIIEDDFRLNFGDLFVYNNRNVIKPLEIDMYSQEHNFGIEYNGLYWHSNKFKTKEYHLKKTELMESQGYQLFHIFENEWLDNQKRDIWKSILSSKLNRTERIYARKCSIKEISSSESNLFLEQNHLQGKCNAKIKIGLFYNEELVSLMTFGQSRFNKTVEYELIRFCSKINLTIVGGASKLLKYFENKYNPKSIISYANRRWSQGNVYDRLGFEFIETTNPNYFYFKPNELKLHSRNQFQKHKLKDKLDIFDPKLTETENMFNNGYRKIFDSGNKKYIKRF